MALKDIVTSHQVSAQADFTSYTHTGHAAAGTPRLVLMWVHWRSLSSANLTGITYGGVAMTQVRRAGAAGSGTRVLDLWKLDASIPTGTQDAVVSWSGSGSRGCVSQVGTFDADSGVVEIGDDDGAELTGQTVPFNVTASALTSAVGENTYGALCVDHGQANIAPNGSESELHEGSPSSSSNYERGQLQLEAGAASVTHDWTVSTAGTSARNVVVSIKEGAAGASAAIPVFMNLYRQRWR